MQENSKSQTQLTKHIPYTYLYANPTCQKSKKQMKTVFFFLFPAQYLVPSFLTRAVLCAGKEAWKRRPFLLSSQICSNYRITSICGSLAAFSLPPPPLSSPVFSLFPSLLFHLHSSLFLIFSAFIFLASLHVLGPFFL